MVCGGWAQRSGYFWVGAALLGSQDLGSQHLLPAPPADGRPFTLSVPQPRAASRQRSWLRELSPEYKSYFPPTASVSVT